jgi:TctA family transporter
MLSLPFVLLTILLTKVPYDEFPLFGGFLLDGVTRSHLRITLVFSHFTTLLWNADVPKCNLNFNIR